MSMQKKTWSARISDETRKRLEQAKIQTGFEPETLLNTMLDAFSIQESDKAEIAAPAMSGPRREIPVIVKALQGALDSMVSAIQLAEAAAVQAGIEAQEDVGVAQSEVETAKAMIVDLKEHLETSTATLTDVQARSTELENALATARDQAESVADLKAAWRQREADLQARIVELDAETQEGRRLKVEYGAVATRAERAEKKITVLTQDLADLRIVADEERRCRVQAEQDHAVAQSKLEDTTALKDNLDEANRHLVAVEKELAVTLAQLESEEIFKQKAEDAHFQTKRLFEVERERLLTDKADAISERKVLAAKVEEQLVRVTELEKQLAQVK